MKEFRLALVAGAIAFALSACQHATDDDGGSGLNPAEQTTQSMHAVLRAPTETGDQFVHIGFHREHGWGVYRRSSPMRTSLLDPNLKPSEPTGSELDEADGIRTAEQAQSTSGPFGGIFGSDDGPRFQASAIAGIEFTTSTPGAQRFTSSPEGMRHPGAAPVAGAQSASRFSASSTGTGSGFCSLRPLCEFVETSCDYRPRREWGSSVLTSCGKISQCYGAVDEINSALRSQLSAQSSCRASSILRCATKHIRSTDVEPEVSEEYPYFYLVNGAFDHCFEQYGIDPLEQLTVSGN
jgi:hypothetical protein